MRREYLAFGRSVRVTCLVLSLGVLVLGQSATAANTSQTLVPQLIKFSGTVTDLAGKPISGPAEVTFSLYSQESGGTPLWYESQTVNANAAGEYTTLLGAMTATGVPMRLFTSGHARWLGVAVRGLPEQSRVLLVSVPYAMTSGNAEMLGGKPASDYLLASQSGTSWTTTTTVAGTSSTSTTSGRAAKQATTASPQSITMGPTANYIAGWESNGTTLGASNIYQDPTTNGIGIGTTAPLASAEIAGSLSTTTPATVLDLSRNYNTGVAYLSAASFLLSNPHVGTNNSRLDIALRNANSNHDALPDATVMSLVSNGNVGIGTTNPASKLDVVGTGGASGTSISVTDQVDATSKYGYAQEAYKLSNPSFNSGAGQPIFSFGAEGNLSNAGAVTNSDFYIFDPAGTGNYEAVFQGNGGTGGEKIGLGVNITDASTLAGAGLVIDSFGNVNVTGILTANSFSGDGSGLTNVGGLTTVIIGSTGTFTGAVSGASFNGALLNGSGNSIAGGGYSTIAGGEGNGVLGLGGHNTIAGGYDNKAGDSSLGSSYTTVGGGQLNTASGTYATVAGGYNDTASAVEATVGGGGINTASAAAATVAGGYEDTASGTYAAVGGGLANTASGDYATVAGGYEDTASGKYSAVGGGELNAASGAMSFAAGCQANALKTGTFVWSGAHDVSSTPTCTSVTASAVGQFIALAPGGFNLYTNTGLSTGCSIAAGGGSWSCTSDREAKANFVPVDERLLLASLNRIPITSWNYKSEKTSLRHLGPMAQDFYEAFRLGNSNKQIGLLDEGGVALAGVQALYHLSLKKDEEIAQLRKSGAAKDARITRLEMQNRKLASEVAKLQKEASAVKALEARLARDEAREKETRTKLARVMRQQKKSSRTELARVQF